MRDRMQGAEPMPGAACAAALAALLLAAPAAAQDAPAPVERAAPATPLRADTGPSGAELLARIQQNIAQDQARLQRLEVRSKELAREFEAASERFARVDARRKELEEAVRAAEAAGAGTERAPTEALEAIVPIWHDARDHFDFVIQRRQAVDQQAEVVGRKIARQQEALDLLSGVGANGAPAAPDAPAAAAAEPGPAEGDVAPAPTPAQPETFDRRVADAQRVLAQHEAELRAVQRRIRMIQDLLALNQDDRRLVEAALEAARAQKAHFEERVALLTAQIEDLRDAGAPAARRQALEERLEAARRHVAAAAEHAEHDTALLASLDERVAGLEAARKRIAERLAAAERTVESTRRRVEFLQSPLAPHRMLRWLLGAAPRILLVLGVLTGAWLLVRTLTRRVVNGLVGRSSYGSEEERQERVETLRRAVQSGLAILIVIVGALLVLPEFGLDVTVLLGGAAVLSLAIAFGAQNLVKDYFYGLMILMENQYRVGNVIRIGNIAGLVEDVTLRMTTLRDLEGVAHFIPHGQISTVSNLTHGWSRVVLDVGVAYKENVDRVMAVLMEVARGMRGDPEFGPLIVDEPEMLGVDAFADSAVIIKLLVRTRPLKQWIVKRELLRRVKNRFDELGIEIPFPHRTVYHRAFEGPLSVTAEPGGVAWHDAPAGGRGRLGSEEEPG